MTDERVDLRRVSLKRDSRGTTAPSGSALIVDTAKVYPMPNIRKHDRRRPWKVPKARGKNSPSDGVRRFRPDGSASLGWEGRPSGSDLDPRLKTKDWRRARAAILADAPVCPICAHVQRVEPATEVDHIIPRKVAPDLFFDRSNLWGLCRWCHQSKTILERKGVNLETPDRWTLAVLIHQGRVDWRSLRGMGSQKQNNIDEDHDAVEGDVSP